MKKILMMVTAMVFMQAALAADVVDNFLLLCDKREEAARAIAQARDSGLPKDKMLKIARANGEPKMATQLVHTVYDEGNIATPDELYKSVRNGCIRAVDSVLLK